MNILFTDDFVCERLHLPKNTYVTSILYSQVDGCVNQYEEGSPDTDKTVKALYKLVPSSYCD